MKNQSQRPIFQAVLKYRYPITAIASILHRVSGVLLFFLIPVFLWLLHQSLASQEGFTTIHTYLSRPFAVTVLWIMMAALIYHLIAGIRHLLMDVGIGDTSMRAGKISAYIVFVLTIITLFILGFLV